MKEVWRSLAEAVIEERVSVAEGCGFLPERERRLFFIDCARRALDETNKGASQPASAEARRALDVATRFAWGEASADELERARLAVEQAMPESVGKPPAYLLAAAAAEMAARADLSGAPWALAREAVCAVPKPHIGRRETTEKAHQRDLLAGYLEDLE